MVPSNHFHCPGFYMVGNVRKGCWKTAGHGDQDLAAAFANSCNAAFADIAVELGAETLRKYTEQAGLTSAYRLDGLTTAKGSFDWNLTQAAWAGRGWARTRTW